MSIAFAHRLLEEVCTDPQRNELPPAFLAQFGLQTYPVVIYLLLKDTSPSAISISWTVCTVALTIESVYLRSWNHLLNLLGYAFSSAILLFDSDRHCRGVYKIVHRLQHTIAAYERQKQEFRAEELRAMIGNVAHDLKTVSTLHLAVDV
jgi:hypothetical protein